MSISIDQAAAEFKQSIDSFVEAYKAKAASNPEEYPLQLPEENAGLWTEFILDYFNNGIVLEKIDEQAYPCCVPKVRRCCERCGVVGRARHKRFDHL